MQLSKNTQEFIRGTLEIILGILIAQAITDWTQYLTWLR